ncbi:MAG: histidine kinase [Lachnospiraceae bacterium]|nr:histidine kinase [Lachnospiraceae bacterium]
MKKIRFGINFTETLSVQSRILLTTILTSVIISVTNLFLFTNINSVIERINRAYMSNVVINNLHDSLVKVNSSMSEYLNTKSSDAMEEYFKNEQEYTNILSEIDTVSNGEETAVLSKNIRNLSLSYMEYSDAAVQARRGHIIEKYRDFYSDAERIYGYINSYIYCLNNEQFAYNTKTHGALVSTFRTLETISLAVLVIMSVINVVLIYLFTRNIMDPVKERELVMETHIKDAELKYLEAQINPHFLFNTLNAGAQLAMMEGADRTSEYIQKMAEFYRYKIHGGSQETTLAKEITLIDNYIYILNVRFSGEIHFEKNINEALINIEMPDMILQPIVENAVNYGIRDSENEGLIKMRVYGSDKDVVVSIQDNGVGMSEERIKQILDNESVASERPDSNGVGLRNVISRLELYYGRRDILTINSEGEGKGTEVCIYLPRENVQDNAG